MVVYIDNDYKCHVYNNGTMRAFDVPDFDGKCEEYIEGYRYVPPGERWVNPKGIIFRGEMTSPWKDYNELEKAQMQYELAQYEAALSAIETALGVTS